MFSFADGAPTALAQPARAGPESEADRLYAARGNVQNAKRAADLWAAQLQKVLDAPLDPDWVPEDHDFKARAVRLLKSLR